MQTAQKTGIKKSEPAGRRPAGSVDPLPPNERRQMLCSQFQLRKQEQEYTEVKLLPCRSWGCDHCAPKRRNQLMAMAASGRPNICLTLTHVYKEGADQVAHYKALHNAWKLLVKRILRQFKKNPEDRWLLKTPEGYEYQEIRGYRITRKTPANEIKHLHYMAFNEATKNGEPHLHILLRTKYIPHKWIADQMNDLIGSFRVWVEKIKTTKAAIGYVSKYISKAPAQFGRSRRYWLSRFYQVNDPGQIEKGITRRDGYRRHRQRFSAFIYELTVSQSLIEVIAPNEIRLETLRQAYNRDGVEPTPDRALRFHLGAAWLKTWKERLRL